MPKPYNPEKIVVELHGRKKVLRVENSFCDHQLCKGYQPHVFLKPGFWPTELLLAHDELKRTLNFCLECRNVVDQERREIIHLDCFELLRVSVLETEKTISAPGPILAT